MRAEGLARISAKVASRAASSSRRAVKEGGMMWQWASTIIIEEMAGVYESVTDAVPASGPGRCR